MDKADAASLTWEEIREALIRFPTEKLLREYLSQRHGASLVSMGILVAPWPSPREPLGVLSFAARSNDLRLIATVWVTKGGEVWLAFEADDPDLAGRLVYFVAYTEESLDSGFLTGGSVRLSRSRPDSGRFEGRCWLGALQEPGRVGPTLVIRYAIVEP
jgi:hypothetical protein